MHCGAFNYTAHSLYCCSYNLCFVPVGVQAELESSFLMLANAVFKLTFSPSTDKGSLSSDEWKKDDQKMYCHVVFYVLSCIIFFSAPSYHSPLIQSQQHVLCDQPGPRHTALCGHSAHGRHVLLWRVKHFITSFRP